MIDYINATDDAIKLLETARQLVVGAVSSVLWRAQDLLRADLRRYLTGDRIGAEVERQHAARYPFGCPNSCEACLLRLGGSRCAACGSAVPVGQSCGCFDNGCQ
jgi:hypothetical protein